MVSSEGPRASGEAEGRATPEPREPGDGEGHVTEAGDAPRRAPLDLRSMATSEPKADESPAPASSTALTGSPTCDARPTAALVEQRGPKARATPRPRESTRRTASEARHGSATPRGAVAPTNGGGRAGGPKAERAEDPGAHGEGRARHSPGLGDASRWRSSLLDQRHAVGRGSEGRRLERRRDPVSPWRTASTTVTGSRRRSSLALVTARPTDARWSSSEGRRLERRRDPATTRRTASTSLTGSRHRSSLALVTARPTTADIAWRGGWGCS